MASVTRESCICPFCSAFNACVAHEKFFTEKSTVSCSMMLHDAPWKQHVRLSNVKANLLVQCMHKWLCSRWGFRKFRSHCPLCNADVDLTQQEQDAATRQRSVSRAAFTRLLQVREEVRRAAAVPLEASASSTTDVPPRAERSSE